MRGTITNGSWLRDNKTTVMAEAVLPGTPFRLRPPSRTNGIVDNASTLPAVMTNTTEELKQRVGESDDNDAGDNDASNDGGKIDDDGEEGMNIIQLKRWQWERK